MVAVPAPPVVAVDAVALYEAGEPAPASRLHGKIVVRLVESGFSVVGPGALADAVLTAVRVDDRLEFKVKGIGDAELTLPFAPDDPVSLLSVVQQATLLIAKAAPARSSQPPGVSAVILVNDPDHEAVVLLEALAVSLTHAGLSVRSAVPALEDGVCVVVRSGFVSVGPSVLGSSCESLGVRDDGRTKVATRDSDDVVSQTVQAALYVLGESSAATRPGRAGAFLVELGVGAGAVGRGSLDPALTLTFGLLRDRGAGGRVSITGVHSRQPPLSVGEVILVGEAVYRLEVTSAWRVVAGFGAGVLVHSYRFGDREREAEADWTASLPVEVSWLFSDSTSVGVALSAGVAGGDRRHVLGDATLWHRQPWRLGIAAIANYRP